MTQYIDKDALVAWAKETYLCENASMIRKVCYKQLLEHLDTLEVIDPYEQCIQYASIESGIKAHAEEYSFNIESDLFNQITKEQQTLWRKEIEQACISGGYNGLDLAKDPRYEENSKVEEVDLEKAIDDYIYTHNGRKRLALELDWKCFNLTLKGGDEIIKFAKHFFELGIEASNKAQKGEEA